MKTRQVLVVIAALAFTCSTSFSECGAYKEEDTISPSATPLLPISGPMSYKTELSTNEILSILRQHGLPVSAVFSNETCLTFTDARLTSSSSSDYSGTFYIYPTNEEATDHYLSLLTNNPEHNFLYQANNIVLRLSPTFTKGQAHQYKTILNILHYVPPVPKSTPAASTPQVAHAESAKDSFSDGTYVIGSNIKKGEYMILSNGDCCHVTLKEGTGEKRTIYKGAFYNDIILTMNPTEVLTISNGTAIPLSKKASFSCTDEGMYKVGTHIKAGTYTVQLAPTNIIGFGTIQIMKDSRFTDDSILTSNTFTKPYKVTLKDGQYIKLSGATLR